MSEEYVRESKLHKHSECIRKRPWHRDNPRPGSPYAQQRAAFIKAAVASRDNYGTVYVPDLGKTIPKQTKVLRDQMKGKKFAEPKPKPSIPDTIRFYVELKKALQTIRS